MRRPIRCQDTKEVVNTYKEYLATEHWRLLRKRYVHVGKVCGICKCDGQMNLHHRTYKHLGQEHKRDVILLCSECHGFLHYCVDKKKTEISRVTRRLKETVNGRIRVEKLIPPKVVRKRQFSLRRIPSSGLPATLHHSIHASVGNWLKKGATVNEVIKKYEKRKKRDVAMLELYKQNKYLVRSLVERLARDYGQYQP